MSVACPRCHTQNEDGARFCGGCGQPFAAAVPQPGPYAQPPQPGPYVPQPQPGPYAPQPPYPAPYPPPYQPQPAAQKKGARWYAIFSVLAGLIAVARLCVAILPSDPALSSTSGTWSILATGQTETPARWVVNYRAGERDAVLTMTGDEQQFRALAWDLATAEPKKLMEYTQNAQLTGWTTGDMFNEGKQNLLLMFSGGTIRVINPDLSDSMSDVTGLEGAAVGDYDGDGQQEMALKMKEENGSVSLRLLRYPPGDGEAELVGQVPDISAQFYFENGTRGAGGVSTLAAEYKDPARVVQYRWDAAQQEMVEDSALNLPADGSTIWWVAGTMADGQDAIVSSHANDQKAWIVIHKYQNGQFTAADQIDLPSTGSWVALPGLFREQQGELAVYNTDTGEYMILGQG